MGRQRPTATYRLVVDEAGLGPAWEALVAAQRAEQRVKTSAVGKGRAAALRKAAQAVADAQAALDACYETIVLRALEPERVEELLAEHPPTQAQLLACQKAREKAAERGEQPPAWPDWDEATYRPAMLAECATEAGMTADDWAAFLASNVSNGEKLGLWREVISVNERERVADPWAVPKGLMAMLSSTSS